MALIDRQTAIDALGERPLTWTGGDYELGCRNQYDADKIAIETVPSIDAVKVVRCKDCKHQEKYFYADKRLKDGGRYSYGCDLAEEYSHVCLDDDFCSRGEQKDG